MVKVVDILRISRPRFIMKNKNNVISWDVEVVSTSNFDQHLPLTKEVAFIFDDVIKYQFLVCKSHTSHVAQPMVSPIVIIL